MAEFGFMTDDDQEQRNFEIVKLRIAFLQQLTTLSGAATLIVLALMQRTESTLVVWRLSLDLALFGIATLGCVVGATRLINHTQMRGHDLERSAGRGTTNLAGAVFGGAVVALMFAGFRIPNLFAFTTLLVASLVIDILYFSSQRRAAPDETE